MLVLTFATKVKMNKHDVDFLGMIEVNYEGTETVVGMKDLEANLNISPTHLVHSSGFANLWHAEKPNFKQYHHYTYTSRASLELMRVTVHQIISYAKEFMFRSPLEPSTRARTNGPPRPDKRRLAPKWLQLFSDPQKIDTAFDNVSLKRTGVVSSDGRFYNRNYSTDRWNYTPIRPFVMPTGDDGIRYNAMVEMMKIMRLGRNRGRATARSRFQTEALFITEIVRSSTAEKASMLGYGLEFPEVTVNGIENGSSSFDLGLALGSLDRWQKIPQALTVSQPKVRNSLNKKEVHAAGAVNNERLASVKELFPELIVTIRYPRLVLTDVKSPEELYQTEGIPLSFHEGYKDTEPWDLRVEGSNSADTGTSSLVDASVIDSFTGPLLEIDVPALAHQKASEGNGSEDKSVAVPVSVTGFFDAHDYSTEYEYNFTRSIGIVHGDFEKKHRERPIWVHEPMAVVASRYIKGLENLTKANRPTYHLVWHERKQLNLIGLAADLLQDLTNVTSVEHLLAGTPLALRAVVIFAFGISGLLKANMEVSKPNCLEELVLTNFLDDVLRGDSYRDICAKMADTKPLAGEASGNEEEENEHQREFACAATNMYRTFFGKLTMNITDYHDRRRGVRSPTQKRKVSVKVRPTSTGKRPPPVLTLAPVAPKRACIFKSTANK